MNPKLKTNVKKQMKNFSTSKKIQHGFFIVFEGIDGSGKTSQAFLLKEFLDKKGYDVILLREPTEGAWGEKIKNILSNGRKGISPEEELNLFIEDRKENINKNILPAIKNNKIIVQDRYYFSSIAYQGALGIDPQQIRVRNEAFAIKPDLLFYLEIRPEIGLKRIDKGRKGKRDTFEKKQYLEKVKKNFDSLQDPFIMKIDGSLSSDFVQKNIQEIVMNRLSLH